MFKVLAPVCGVLESTRRDPELAVSNFRVGLAELNCFEGKESIAKAFVSGPVVRSDKRVSA